MIYFFSELYNKFSFSDEVISYLSMATVIFIMLFSIILFNIIFKFLVNNYIKKLVSKTKTRWDDILFKRGIFIKIGHIVPTMIIYYFSFFFEGGLQLFLQKVSYLYVLLLIIIIINTLLTVVEDIYNLYPVSKDKPIKSYIQVLKMFIIILGSIIIIGDVIGKSPWKLLSGIGAMTAVLLLVFKDSILGFVAGIQISANNMVKIGDWIEVPKYGADGDVIEINLTNIKVQNWDKTITTLPVYALTTESFKNWRGMSESGGRRIKRSVKVDMHSVKFCDDEMLKRFKKIEYIKEYINEKEKEIKKYNEDYHIDMSSFVNGRRLTNLGTFRAYIFRYLKNHPLINQNMTLLVRQLELTENGIPIEVYAFTSDTAWANYENIQSDIFDHILSIINEFDLSVFQNPSGEDFKNLKK
ncbi:MAG: mechanosensitive ion channel [Fusobacteria bacterium]|nr:mechanosensitive ion channel [Fusobacteriota bacterium]